MLQDNIIKEKSCGALVFTLKFNRPHILLIEQVKGHWSFPKGHIENNEVKEETNLDIKIIDGFRVVNTYSPYKGCMKDVVLFVAIPTSFKLQRQIEEVKRLGWFSIKKALSLLTHESDKQILKNAYKFFVDYLSFSLD